MTTPAERRRILRWLAAVGLLAAAEDHLGVDVAETNALGLLAAHASCEAMLGLVAGAVQQLPAREIPKRGGLEPGFHEVLAEAEAAADPPLDGALVRELRAMHQVRNGFVHAGLTVDHAELERAIDAAHLLSERVPDAGPRPTRGLASTVASIVDVPAVSFWLDEADTARLAGRLGASADATTRALEAALDRTRPRLRWRTGRRSSADIVRFMQSIGGSNAALHYEQDRAAIARELDGLATWVYPLVLGTTPATMDWLWETLGREDQVDTSGHLRPVRRAGDPSPGELRRATSIVCRLLLRMWWSGQLRSMPRDVDLVVIWRADLEAGGPSSR